MNKLENILSLWNDYILKHSIKFPNDDDINNFIEENKISMSDFVDAIYAQKKTNTKRADDNNVSNLKSKSSVDNNLQKSKTQSKSANSWQELLQAMSIQERLFVDAAIKTINSMNSTKRRQLVDYLGTSDRFKNRVDRLFYEIQRFMGDENVDDLHVDIDSLIDDAEDISRHYYHQLFLDDSKKAQDKLHSDLGKIIDKVEDYVGVGSLKGIDRYGVVRDRIFTTVGVLGLAHSLFNAGRGKEGEYVLKNLKRKNLSIGEGTTRLVFENKSNMSIFQKIKQFTDDFIKTNIDKTYPGTINQGSRYKNFVIEWKQAGGSLDKQDLTKILLRFLDRPTIQKIYHRAGWRNVEVGMIGDLIVKEGMTNFIIQYLKQEYGIVPSFLKDSLEFEDVKMNNLLREYRSFKRSIAKEASITNYQDVTSDIGTKLYSSDFKSILHTIRQRVSNGEKSQLVVKDELLKYWKNKHKRPVDTTMKKFKTSITKEAIGE